MRPSGRFFASRENTVLRELPLPGLHERSRRASDEMPCPSSNRILYIAQSNLNEAAIEAGAFRRTGWVVGMLVQAFSPAIWGQSVTYLRRGKGFPLEAHDLNAAVNEFDPAVVVPDYMGSIALMHAVANDSSSNASTRRVLRCSLSSPEFWPALESKSAMIELARRSGLRVPRAWSLMPWAPAAWQVHALLRYTTVQLPLVLKSDVDGVGFGVTICQTPACIDELPEWGVVSAQEFVEGATTTYVAAAVDGVLLGGFSLIKQVSECAKCPSRFIRTANLAEQEVGIRKMLGLLRYTGISATDFVTTTQGHSYLIDFNGRMSNFAAIDEVAGLKPSLLQRLRMSVSSPRGHRTTDAAQLPFEATSPLPYSLLVAKYIPAMWADRAIALPLWKLLSCSDVYMHVPWGDPWALSYGAPPSLIINRSTCTMWHRDLPQFMYRQKCSKSQERDCPGALGMCEPLRTAKPIDQFGVVESCALDRTTGLSRFQLEHAACGRHHHQHPHLQEHVQDHTLGDSEPEGFFFCQMK